MCADRLSTLLVAQAFRPASAGLKPCATVVKRVAPVLLLVAVASACAHKPVATPTIVTAPKFPEFIRPAIPPALATAPVATMAARGWAFLQAGDLKNAEHEFSTALKQTPTFYPAEASLGYLELARQDPKAEMN